ncbi:hypothetical protein LDENG_00066570 [Lucifuga dentata]|nr:hypothetical protein LDENG_00066570 [Lucifuga dentata]
MLQAARPENQSSAVVSLLDWYALEKDVILVMERPTPSSDLHQYVKSNGGYLTEDEAKVILKQLVEAAADMNSKGVFHWDIKTTNLLIDTSSDVPQVRVIDFGCGCYARERETLHQIFWYTSIFLSRMVQQGEIPGLSDHGVADRGSAAYGAAWEKV